MTKKEEREREIGIEREERRERGGEREEERERDRKKEGKRERKKRDIEEERQIIDRVDRKVRRRG